MCANSNDLSLLEDVNRLNVFGKCHIEQLTYSAREELKREEQFKRARREREKELKKQEQKRKEEQEEDQRFLEEEKRKLGLAKPKKYFVSPYVPPNARSSYRGGRGAFLEVEEERMPRARGRGLLSTEEKKCLPLFQRESNVQKNLHKVNGPLHDNKLQKEIWKVEKNKEEYDPASTSDFDDYLEQKPIVESMAFLSVSGGPEDDFSWVDANELSDHFEDAESSVASSPQSFNTVPSKSSSPINGLLQPSATSSRPRSLPLASPSHQRKPKGSRLAAKFDYVENDTATENSAQEETGNGKEDSFAVLGSSRAPLAPSGFRKGRGSNGGISFNDLRPSNRVLSNNALTAEEKYLASVSGSKGFVLNNKDFPAL